MNARKLSNLAAAIALPIVSSTAMAQPETIYLNEIEIGAGYTNIDSFKFGEYTGIEDDGVFPIANIVLLRRPAWDSDETPRYWRLEGNNLGIESRSIYGEYGVQGNYEVFIEYDQIPHNQFDDGRTPFIGAGGDRLTLPPTWVPSTTTAGMTNLLPSLRGFEVETERQNIGAGVLKHLSRRWKVGLDFHHDTKEGIDVIGASFGVNGGNPRAMLLPEPVDYETNRINFFTEYVDKKSMFRFDYEFSAFNNDTSSLTFRNPYLAVGGFNPWPAGATADFTNPDAFGQMALPPDNLAHSLSVSAARTLGQTSRIAASLTHTRYEQDERFLPYSANVDLAVPTLLPRDSLDGEISNTIFDIAYTSRPIQKLDMAARYRFDYRDNDTPFVDPLIYIRGDSEDQPAFPGGGNRRLNLRYGTSTTHKVKLDGGYRVIPSTKLSLGYEFEHKERDFAEVDTTREHTVSAKVSSRPVDTVDGWIRYARAMRDGSAYRDNFLFLAGHPNSTSGFENDPRLRKYNIADRDRDEVRGVLNYMPAPQYSVTLDASFRLDDYSETQIGLSEQRMTAFTIDFGLNPRDDITVNAWATYENLRGEQNGCEWAATTDPCIATPPAPADSWNSKTEDNIFTFGVGATWQVNSKLGVGTDISFSRALTEVNTTGGANLTTAPFPDIVSHWYSLGAHLNYKVKKNIEARLGYAYESLRTDDWALDGVTVNTLANVITLGEASPNYNGHVIGLALSYKF